jgi:hypothetical protein
MGETEKTCLESFCSAKLGSPLAERRDPWPPDITARLFFMSKHPFSYRNLGGGGGRLAFYNLSKVSNDLAS